MIISFVFCKQKTAYEMRISDWSSDVCSSDLTPNANAASLQPKQDGTTRDSSKNCTGRIGLQSGAFLKNAGSSDFPLKTHEKPPPRALAEHQIQLLEIGNASCRERVCQYVSISVVAESLKKKQNKKQIY